MNSDLKVALVTGGTRGIGFQIAQRLLDDGKNVLVTGTKKIANYPKGSKYLQVDFLDSNSKEDFFKALKLYQVDILINNAGINKIDSFVDIKPEDFDNILEVNLKIPFLLCQEVIPGMKKRKWGRIINISSIFGNISKEYRAAYSASKFGLDGMTIALSAELSKYNILANLVSPGIIDTDLTRNILGAPGIEQLRKQIPIGRLGNTNEIASMVSWLASNENTYLTGQNIIIDGGFSRV